MERDLLPDAVIRFGIRQLLKDRIACLPLADPEKGSEYLSAFLKAMSAAPVAPVPEKANEQHYEVPADFFGLVLGARRKYSSCYWPPGVKTLNQAEEVSLGITTERALLENGQEILELGCGWGSLSLFMAEKYPKSKITAVSNSASQRAHIMSVAAERGLENLTVITADMNDFQAESRFDRVVSVEMFEHMRNWEVLLNRVAQWLKPGGMFFKHIFCHKSLPYEFTVEDESDWMGRYFFSGGIMPNYDLPLHFQNTLKLDQQWAWNGRHYEQTANAWLANMDQHKQQIWPQLAGTYGEDQAQIWWVRWRVFFMACAELFGYAGGSEWFVGHYRFRRPE